MATHSNILAWKNPVDRGAKWATVQRVTDSGMTEWAHIYTEHSFLCYIVGPYWLSVLYRAVCICSFQTASPGLAHALILCQPQVLFGSLKQCHTSYLLLYIKHKPGWALEREIESNFLHRHRLWVHGHYTKETSLINSLEATFIATIEFSWQH